MTSYLDKFSLRKVQEGVDPLLVGSPTQGPVIVSGRILPGVSCYLQLAVVAIRSKKACSINTVTRACPASPDNYELICHSKAAN